MSGKAKPMSKAEAGSLGGKALVAKYGREYMAQIGARGWQAALASVAGRYPPPRGYEGGNYYRSLLKNLKRRKQNERDTGTAKKPVRS